MCMITTPEISNICLQKNIQILSYHLYSECCIISFDYKITSWLFKIKYVNCMLNYWKIQCFINCIEHKSGIENQEISKIFSGS